MEKPHDYLEMGIVTPLEYEALLSYFGGPVTHQSSTIYEHVLDGIGF